MEPTTQIDTPAPAATEPTEQPATEPTSEVAEDTPNQEPAATVAAPPAEPIAEEAEEEFSPVQQVSPVQPLDFSQIPVDENNLIDANALVNQFNQRLSQVEQNALARAQQVYAEQEQEKHLWTKAYDKYPDLKGNKDLEKLVYDARLGEATTQLSRAKTQAEVQAMNLPTPLQMADKLFKHLGTAKTEGIQQATVNTEVQKSAYLETAGKRGDSSAESTESARKNINNPNKQVANKARSELLKKYLGWD